MRDLKGYNFINFAMYYAELAYNSHISGPSGLKGPGIPWNKMAKTNADLDKKFVLDVIKQRLLLLSSADDLEGLTALELVSKGYCDPVRLFVKNELHSAAKVASGKVRLIFNVSLPDLIIEMLLFDPFNKACIDSYLACPSLPGMGFHDEGYDAMRTLIRESMPKAFASSDVSGMDWNVKVADFVKYGIVASNNSGASPNSELGLCMRNRLRCLSLSMIYTSDGLVIEQVVPGVMKSGSKLTSAIDSCCRVTASCEVGASLCRELNWDFQDWLMKHLKSVHAMGDDCIEPLVPDAIERYAALGMIIKEYFEVSLESGFDFCGHRFSANPVKLVRWEKSLAELLQGSYQDRNSQNESFAGLCFELRNQPEVVEFYQRVLLASGWWMQNT